MQGKIALEEHFALADTLVDLDRRLSGGDIWSDTRRRLLDTRDLRLAEMDNNGIELVILSHTAPGIQELLSVEEAVELSMRANDLLAEEIALHPNRFAGFAALPMQDPDAAITELTRCIKDLGFKGALVNGFTQKDVSDSVIYYDIPEYRPFWAALEDFSLPFYMHPRTIIAERAQAYEGHPWLYSSAWGFSVEASIHSLRLIGSGLFDDHPKLQIILGHLGERIPFDMWRLDHRIERLPCGYSRPHPMSYYLKNNFHMTTSGNFYGPTFEFTVNEMGIERIMFSVDYPFEDTTEGATWFDEMEMTEDTRLKIGRTNAIELFKLDLE